MKVLIILILKTFFLFHVSLFAQQSGMNWNNLDTTANHIGGKLRGEEFNISVESSIYQFLFNDFYDGTVTLVDGKVIKNVKIRYQAYLDELVLYNPKMLAQFCLLDKNSIQEFTIFTTSSVGRSTPHKFIKLTGLYPNTKKQRYLEQLYSGSKLLLAHHKIIKEHVNDYIDDLGMNMENRYRMRTRYFIYDGQYDFREIKSKRRLFIKFFEDGEQEVRRELRKNKIRFRKKGELEKAVRIMDSAGLL